MIFLYFLFILFIVNSGAIFICTTFDCDGGGWHDWKAVSWKTTWFNESGYRISVKYCVDYRCRKCGKLDLWRDR